MSRKAEFRVVPPSRKASLIVRPRRKAPPSIDIEHRTLGVGRLVGLRPSGSGGFVCDVKFGSITRTLKLDESYWVTPISDVVALLPMFPQSKSPVEKESKVERADESEESETEELSAERAFFGDADSEAEGEDFGDGVEMEIA